MRQQAAALTHHPKQPSSEPAGGILQRKCACGQHTGAGGEYAACRKKRMQLQRKATQASEPGSVPSIVHEVLRSPGRPLDPATRAFMEPRFGHDFSGVRVHTDAKAAESARAVNAQAYTIGRDIVFDSGQYAPHTLAGQRLFAHEITHVIQQHSAPALRGGPIAVDAANDSYEQEADRAASTISTTGGGSVPSPRAAPVSLQRQPNNQAGSGSRAMPANVPYEKWAEEIEGQYRRRGDVERADAIRACRMEGGDACSRLLTIEEVEAFYGSAGLSLRERARIQEELRSFGFIILENPLGLCIGGCHLPSPGPGSPSRPPEFLLGPREPFRLQDLVLDLSSTAEINPDAVILIEIDLPTAAVTFTTVSGGTFHGDVVTDLSPGEYRLTANKEEEEWVIHGSRPGLRFDLNLRDADPWQMDYAPRLRLRVHGEAQPPIPTTDTPPPRARSARLNFYHGTRWSVAKNIPGNVKPLGGGDFATGFYTHQDEQDVRALRRAKTWGRRLAREANEKYAGVVLFSVPNQDYLDLLGSNARVFDFTRTDQPDYEERQREWLSFVTAHGRESEPVYDSQRHVWVHPRREPQPQLPYAIIRGPFYGPIRGTPDRKPGLEEFHPFAEGKRLPQQVVWANDGIPLLNSSKTNTELQQYDAKTGERKDPPEDEAVTPVSPSQPQPAPVLEP